MERSIYTSNPQPRGGKLAALLFTAHGLETEGLQRPRLLQARQPCRLSLPETSCFGSPECFDGS